MLRSLEERARVQCAVDAYLARVAAYDVPHFVERYWVVVAYQMMGVVDPPSVEIPDDMKERVDAYRQFDPA